MHWYDRLADYFPEHEMKHKGQMEALLSHHEAYRKYETPDYLVTYAEFRDFIFIDYLLVYPSTRGKGIGSAALNLFKKRGKTIILEVELPDDDDHDTLRRIQFYEKNGFQKADHIEYTRADEDGTLYTMDVYYWSPESVSEQAILKQIALVCREIHNFRTLKYYGRVVANPEQVLNWVHLD